MASAIFPLWTKTSSTIGSAAVSARIARAKAARRCLKSVNVALAVRYRATQLANWYALTDSAMPSQTACIDALTRDQLGLRQVVACDAGKRLRSFFPDIKWISIIAARGIAVGRQNFTLQRPFWRPGNHDTSLGQTSVTY